MPDPDDVPEEGGGRAVVGVVVGVDQVRDGAGEALRGGGLVDRPLQATADAGGASNSTTPSLVTRNAELYTPSVTQYRFRSTRPT
jgi:hypothetical protein